VVLYEIYMDRVMMFKVTINNISAISCFLEEETGISLENQRPPQVTDKLDQIMLY